MIKIFTPQVNNIHEIQTLAQETWLHTYINIISREQIEYMLNAFYNTELIEEQMSNSHHHFIALQENKQLLAYAHAIEQENSMKLSKLYVHPTQHNKGFGKILLQAIEKKCLLLQKNILELCVNKFNPAKHFYESQGFFVVREEDFPIGEYWMNDYVMEKII
jgi:GNAT superfamily N-acetyltransferase